MSSCARPDHPSETPREELYRAFLATQEATTPGGTLEAYYIFRQAMVDTMFASNDPNIFAQSLLILQKFADATAILLSAGDGAQAEELRSIIREAYLMVP